MVPLPRWRNSRIAATLVLVALSSCEALIPPTEPETEETFPTGPDQGSSQSGTARLSVWTDATSTGPIDVTVNRSAAGTLSTRFSSAPQCGQSGTLTVTVPSGATTISARSSNGTTWPDNTVQVGANQCFLYQLRAPTGGGGGGGGGGASGTRVSLCVQNIQPFANAVWHTLPAPFNGLDAKVWWSATFSTADVIFRNRYHERIFHSFDLYAGGSAPPSDTGHRHDLGAGVTETPPGPILGVRVGQGGTACVIVDRVRFGTDTGAYH